MLYILGRRQQLNQATSYIDASYLYGADEDTASTMREFQKGTTLYNDQSVYQTA